MTGLLPPDTTHGTHQLVVAVDVDRSRLGDPTYRYMLVDQLSDLAAEQLEQSVSKWDRRTPKVKVDATPILDALATEAARRDGGIVTMFGGQGTADYKLYYRCRDRGWIDLRVADRLAVTYLGVPSTAMYPHGTEIAA